jgi:hypothetical protein
MSTCPDGLLYKHRMLYDDDDDDDDCGAIARMDDWQQNLCTQRNPVPLLLWPPHTSLLTIPSLDHQDAAVESRRLTF